MAEPTLPADRPSSDTVCPWCSASLPPDAANCPSCGAILTAEEERELPGVTAIDPSSLLRSKPTGSRNRLLSWISGEYPEEATDAAANTDAIAPPDAAVQREILRLELEAEVANLQAEADAMMSDAVEEGRVIEVPEELRPFASIESVDDATSDDAAAEGEGASSASAAEEAVAAPDEATSDDGKQAEDSPPN